MKGFLYVLYKYGVSITLRLTTTWYLIVTSSFPLRINKRAILTCYNVFNFENEVLQNSIWGINMLNSDFFFFYGSKYILTQLKFSSL